MSATIASNEKFVRAADRERIRMKNKGFGIVGAVVAVVAVMLIAAAAWLGAEAVKKRGLERGAAALAAGDYAQAAEHLARAEKFSLRGDAAVLTALGEAREGLGDIPAAKECYSRAAEAEGAHEAAHYRLAMIYIREKNFEAARTEVAALEKLGTAEASQYAKELKQEIGIGSVKSLFDGIVEKVLPELGIGGKPAETGGAK